MTGLDNRNHYRQRTSNLAVAVVKFFGSLPKDDYKFSMGKQLLRSATSVAANYRAFCRGRSEKERYHKLCIVVEEADETCFWLELFVATDLVPLEQVKNVLDESYEILKIMAALKGKLKKDMNTKK